MWPLCVTRQEQLVTANFWWLEKVSLFPHSHSVNLRMFLLRGVWVGVGESSAGRAPSQTPFSAGCQRILENHQWILENHCWCQVMMRVCPLKSSQPMKFGKKGGSAKSTPKTCLIGSNVLDIITWFLAHCKRLVVSSSHFVYPLSLLQ